MRMLADNILIDEFKEGKSQLVLADNKRAEIKVGIVLEVGPGQTAVGQNVEIVPPNVKKGDKVYYIKDRAIKIEGHFAVKERDLICVC